MKLNLSVMVWTLTLLLASVGRANDQDALSYQTFGTVGKEVTPLSLDHEAELFHHEGRGCLTHMWFGGGWTNCENTRLRIYVDGETNASIDMALYLGHGIGFGDQSAPWGTLRFGKTGSGANVYDTYRIPFGKSVRVTAQLAPGAPAHPLFWWIIRGTENPMPLGFGIAFWSFPAVVLAVLAVFLYQGRTHFIEQRLQSAAVPDGLPERGHKFLGHVEAAPAAFLGERQQPGRMLLPPRAGGAVFPDAGLVDLV